jgi:hypothetical protein
MLNLYLVQVILFMREIGLMISQMEKEYKFILMDQNIKVNLLTVLKMITMQYINGQMEKHM